MIGNVLFSVFLLAVVLGVLVFVHELGHYIAAKAFGVWVHRFAIGIGRPIPGLSFYRGETQWAIAWLPLGGYVKMASREEDPASSVLEGGSATQVPPDRVFEAKPVWQRMIIILAGVTMNLLFALVVFSALAWKNGRHYDPTTTIGGVVASELPAQARAMASVPAGTRIVSVDGHVVHSWDDIVGRIADGSANSVTLHFDRGADVVIALRRDALVERQALALAIQPVEPAVIGALEPGMPAIESGLAVGDSLVAIDQIPVNGWADAVVRIQPSAGQPLRVDVVRHGVHQSMTITPRPGHEVPADPASPVVGRIGAGVRSPYVVEALSLPDAIVAGADASWSAAGMIVRMLRGIAEGQVSSKEVGGPILVGQMAAQQARLGFDSFLAFMGLIAVNLAVVNLLPIPVLDGGAFLLLLIEGVIRRPLPLRLREAMSLVGLALVVLLMVVVFKNDIFRLAGH